MRADLHSPAPLFNQAGLGLRGAFFAPLAEQTPSVIDFLEIAPENWIGIGGKRKKQLQQVVKYYPLICHGLSLSLGGPAPLDETLLTDIKQFLDEYQIAVYSEHLSFCSDDAQLYNLFPIPFTAEAVRHVSKRIRQAQNILERRIAVENPSYYCVLDQEMSEIDFINAVLKEADCDLLLDINNIYVNSVNHHYDPLEFINAIQPQKIAYLHIAGHYRETDDLIIDSHGAAVIDPVWDLLEKTYARFGALPTLLERDLQIPSFSELLTELHQIKQIQIDCKAKCPAMLECSG